RRRLWRLARRADGACVFLGEDNLCRLHAETGAQTKPLACRAYPFVAVPGVGGPRVDLRFDCPSVAGNRGRTLSVHASEVGRLAAESGITGGAVTIPAWGRGRHLTGEEFLAVAAAFDRILQTTAQPLRRRLRIGCQLLDVLYGARIDRVRDERFVELMEMLTTAALQQAEETADEPAPPLPPSRKSIRLFRQWLFLHTIADDPESLSAGRLARLRNSWRRYGYARQFSRADGRVPPVRPDWPATTFAVVSAIGPASEDALEPLCRAMRVKLDAHSFAGPGYFGCDVLAGLTALWLLPAVVGWLARLAAVGGGRGALTAADVVAGVRQAHHTFGVSPVFGRIRERLRLRGLARPGIPAAILAAYGP
ncbi:MAG: YkgJ family cysteine cluster protein, partial [Planctomycetes bacterium]|nr:YkgJ family cysteine cluster protein [Planctomycetota bacterium]